MKNGLSRVVILFLLTLAFLFALSLLPPLKVWDRELRSIDLLSDLRDVPDDDIDEFAFIDDTADGPSGPIAAPQPHTIATDSTARTLAAADSLAGDTLVADSLPPMPKVKAVEGDIALLEDYTTDGSGLQHLAAAIARQSQPGRPVRIAFLGDSFIEADIFTQHVRQLLQQRYGGKGVGYMAMHSDFPGFRRSITQTDSGWEVHSVLVSPHYAYMSLPLQYYVPQGKARTRLRGSKRYSHAATWDVTRVLYETPQNAWLTLATDSTTETYELAPTQGVQMITLAEPTSHITVSCDGPQAVRVWGVWLDGTTGVAVDNISMRGYSGSSIATVPAAQLTALCEQVPYDLVVLQYGLNRMSAGILNYDSYCDEMTRVVKHLRAAMPQTDVLIMGIGDRCANRDGTMKTMREVYAMRQAQRRAARAGQCLFWDTCEAMQLQGGMKRYVENGWANKDYTHLSHAGGRPLAQSFVRALGHALGDSITVQMARGNE